MKLRVIAGDLRGRRFRAPPGRRTRPTRSAVREAWFNALAPELQGARIVDLFAGSGALGIEALSRGAVLAEFVESDPAAYRVLRANLAALGLESRARPRRADVFRTLRAAEADDWDVALADPPYATGVAERLVRRWLDVPFAGILCVEHGRGELAALADRPAGVPAWHRTYGDTELSFFTATRET